MNNGSINYQKYIECFITFRWIGQEALRRYYKSKADCAHLPVKEGEVFEIRKTRGGAILDQDDVIKNILDDNDFVSVGEVIVYVTLQGPWQLHPDVLWYYSICILKILIHWFQYRYEIIFLESLLCDCIQCNFSALPFQYNQH